MKYKQKKYSAVIFLIIMLSITLITFIRTKTYFSEIENRELAKFPKLSFGNIMNKTFMNQFELYLSDHFFKRIEFIGVKINSELFLGKKELKGVYITENRLVEKMPSPNYKAMKQSVEAINKIANSSDVPVYALLAPTSAGIYYDEVYKDYPQIDQRKLLNNVYNEFSKNITLIDVFSKLHAVRDEYIYYRNDHHWTCLGAYNAYSSTVKKMGFTPVAFEKYDIEHANNDFYGTFFSSSLYDKLQADIIDIYRYKEGTSVTGVYINNGFETNEYSSIYFKEFLEKKDKYSVYLGQNQPMVKIKTNTANNKKLLIFKDSYAHSFVPFLTQHYNEIVLLDMRYLDDYKKFVNIEDYNQVLFLYNISTFSQDQNIRKIAYDW